MPATGRYTGCDLSDLTALSLPWQMENGQLRPRFSRSAAMLSLELAEAAYELAEDRWGQAGWRDILYRGTEIAASPEEHGGTGLGGMVQSIFHKLRQNVSVTLRNKEEKKLDKALFMAHPLPDGRVVIAVGLMGTEMKLSDWSVNLRVENENGMHQGFASVADGLMESLGSIRFRDTARQLGLPSLTLADVVGECRKPGSRFVLWLSGHSQGAAVMQLFALRLVRGGVMPRYLIGYGFASPRVLYEGYPGDITDFPIFHILNRDDTVPKLGALLHIGRCQLYTPDEQARKTWFPEDWEDENFRRLFSLADRIHSTADGMVFLTALLKTLHGIPDEEALAAFTETLARYLPDKFSGMLTGRIRNMLDSLQSKAQQTYLTVSEGKSMPEIRVRLLTHRLSLENGRMGAFSFLRRVIRIFTVPHRLAEEEKGELLPSYAMIVTRQFYALRPCLSGEDVPPWQGKRERPSPHRGQQGRFGAYSAGRRKAASRKTRVRRMDEAGSIHGNFHSDYLRSRRNR